MSSEKPLIESPISFISLFTLSTTKFAVYTVLYFTETNAFSTPSATSPTNTSVELATLDAVYETAVTEESMMAVAYVYTVLNASLVLSATELAN